MVNSLMGLARAVLRRNDGTPSTRPGERGAQDGLHRDTQHASDLCGGQAVLGDGGTADGGARLHSATAQAATADLRGADAKLGRIPAAERPNHRARVEADQRLLRRRELRDDLFNEGATAEHALIERPALTTTFEHRDAAPAEATPQTAAAEISGVGDAHPFGNKAGVRLAVAARMTAEVSEHSAAILLRKDSIPEQHGVTGPRVVSKGIDGLDEARPQRVEMDVANQGEQVGFVLDENGLEAVLKQVADAAISAVEGDGVTGQQAPQQRGQRHGAGTQEQVEVIGKERPRIEARIDDLPGSLPDDFRANSVREAGILVTESERCKGLADSQVIDPER